MKNTGVATTYTILKPEKKTPPTIIFSQKALKWIDALVNSHETEVGFYGVVDSDVEHYTYRVSDIFYPKHQLMTAVTCEISKDGETALMEWLINKDRADEIGKLMLWGHSHHTMGVNPSGQDETQMMQRVKDTNQSTIRIIANKAGLINVSFVDFEQGIRFDNIVWKEEEVDSKAECARQLASINAIISSDKPEEEKIKEIDVIMYSDFESEKIKEKIEELKKENIPSVATTTVYANGFSNCGYGRTYPHLENFPTPGDKSKFVDLNKHAKYHEQGRRGKQKHGDHIKGWDSPMYPYDEFDSTQSIHDMVEKWDGL